MVLTNEMTAAFDAIENTNECLFITGKAGTGKTTLLKYIVDHAHKKLAVTASTGIAAINAGGVTLHSLFNIPLGVQDPNSPMKGKIYADKIQLFKTLELLIIDEISMVRPDTIDYIDSKLRLYRMNDQPFGGIQVVMFGDLYQLPPVVKSAEKEVLLQMYRGVYFFYAHAFRNTGFRIIELNHVFRQTDARFVEILNNIRCYKMTMQDMDDLDELRDYKESQNFDNNHIHICSFRKDVQKINAQMLGEPTHVFDTEYIKDFPTSSAPCGDKLEIREGARVMMLINDPQHRFYNGSMGEVVCIGDENIVVDLDDGGVVSVEPYEWVAQEYKTENGNIETVEKGRCRQFPIALAWAITIHKSQGLTFDNITIHSKYVFCPGQLYVALSRCRSMQGIITESFINKRYIIPDKELLAFERAYKKCKNIFNRDTYRMMNLK